MGRGLFGLPSLLRKHLFSAALCPPTPTLLTRSCNRLTSRVPVNPSNVCCCYRSLQGGIRVARPGRAVAHPQHPLQVHERRPRHPLRAHRSALPQHHGGGAPVSLHRSGYVRDPRAQEVHIREGFLGRREQGYQGLPEVFLYSQVHGVQLRAGGRGIGERGRRGVGSLRGGVGGSVRLGCVSSARYSVFERVTAGVPRLRVVHV